MLDEGRRKGFFADAAQSMIRGGRVYDFHIGIVALAAGASAIVTENKKHFLTLENQGVPVLSAKEFLKVVEGAS